MADIIELDTGKPTAKSIINWLHRHQDEIDHITVILISGDSASIAHDDRPIAEIVCDCRTLARYGDDLLLMGED